MIPQVAIHQRARIAFKWDMVCPDECHPPTKAGLTLDSLPVFKLVIIVDFPPCGESMYIYIYIHNYTIIYIYIYIYYVFIYICDMVGPSEANPSFVHHEKHPAVPAFEIRI